MTIRTLEFDGRNELRSIVSAHEPAVPPNGRYPFTDFSDLYTDAAWRMRKRMGRGAIVATLPAACVQLHEFERVDPVTGASTFYQFAATAANIYRGPLFNAAETLPISPTGSFWCFLNFENRCFAVNGKEAMIVFDGTNWRIVGVDAPTATLVYSLGGIVTAGTVSITNGSATIVGVGTSFDNSGAWNNLYGDFNGVRYQIASVTDTTHLTLTEKIKEATAAGLPYKVYTGVMSWTNGPKYAAAYYNPTTGHCSEPGPQLQIAEKDQIGVTPAVTLPHAAQNATAYAAGYTQIKFFRTFTNGSQLRAMNVVKNNVNDAVTDITLTEDATSGKDTILTDLLLPKETNRKPPTAITAIAAWQGRMWAQRPSDPTNTPADSPRTYFSCAKDETPIGVPEECWPRRFERHGINQPKGLLSVGGPGSANGLVIQSGDGDFTLDGYDNFTYTNPYRMPTRRSGGFLFGAIDARGEMIQLYRDKRLMAGETDLGVGIQDKLNLIQVANITGSRMHLFAYETNDIFLLSIPKSTSSNSYTLVVDYDHPRMNEWNFGFSAATTFHSSGGALELWIGDATGALYKLLQSVFVDGASTQYQPFFRTGPIRSGTRRQLRRVHIFVGPAASTPAALTWVLNYRKDEEATGTNVNFYVMPSERQSAAGLELIYEFEKPVIYNTLDLKVTYPSTTTDLYIEKMVVVDDDAQTSGAGS